MADQRRRILLIDRKFQYALIGRLLLVQLLLLLVTVVALWTFLDSEIGTTLSRAHITVTSVRELLWPVLATIAGVNALVAIGITFVVVLVASHRIAGPLYRVQSALSALEQGDLAPLTSIREHDQTGPLAAQLASTVRQVAEDVALAQRGLEGAEARFAEAGLAVPAEVSAARERLLRYKGGAAPR